MALVADAPLGGAASDAVVDPETGVDLNGLIVPHYRKMNLKDPSDLAENRVEIFVEVQKLSGLVDSVLACSVEIFDRSFGHALTHTGSIWRRHGACAELIAEVLKARIELISGLSRRADASRMHTDARICATIAATNCERSAPKPCNAFIHQAGPEFARTS
jgi:hypothetical protein